jgi:hypothetical protein
MKHKITIAYYFLNVHLLIKGIINKILIVINLMKNVRYIFLKTGICFRTFRFINAPRNAKYNIYISIYSLKNLSDEKYK